MTYEQAVELAKKKDDAGFRFLYESTYRDKYYIALKYMQNEDDALDVLQDAYIRAFDKLDTLDNAEKFPAWLGMIVANTAKNALVKKKPILFSEMSTETEDGDPFEFQIEDEKIESQPELSFTRKETKELVQQMISSLSEEQRLCILMFYMEEMSIRDIAETLECSENTVKSRLNYGRKNLKIKGEELQKEGYKLYGVAPLPLLLYLLHAEGMDYLSWTGIADLLTYQKVLEPSLAGGGHPHTDLPVSSGMKSAGKVVKQFIHTAVGKVAIGTAAVVATAGVAAAVIHSQSSDDAEPVMQESIEMIAQGTEAVGGEEIVMPESNEENMEESAESEDSQDVPVSDNVSDASEESSESQDTPASDDDSDVSREWDDSQLESVIRNVMESPEASGECETNLTWYYQNVILVITGAGKVTVEIFDAPWYDFADQIGWVILDEGVTGIGDKDTGYVFSEYPNMTKITIPESVTSIGFCAFWNSRKLAEITIPESITSIGDCIFAYCAGLTKITIPKSVTIIDEGAFAGCISLAEITIPESVTNIGESAFARCTGLTEITISESVTSIGEEAFVVCSGLTEITIPKSVTSIGERAFGACRGLTEITILCDAPADIETMEDILCWFDFENVGYKISDVTIYYTSDTFDKYIDASREYLQNERNIVWIKQ